MPVGTSDSSYGAKTEFIIREVGSGDEVAIDRLLGGLDGRSRYRRWFSEAVDVGLAAQWAAHPERIDAVGLLAVAEGASVGHGVLVVGADGCGEVAFEVDSQWRHHGIAGALLERLLDLAAARGLREVYAEVLSENADMLAVLREHSEHSESRLQNVVTVRLPVGPRPATTLSWPRRAGGADYSG